MTQKKLDTTLIGFGGMHYKFTTESFTNQTRGATRQRTLNQSKMKKLTYTTSMIQKRVPDEIKAELIEMIDIRVASFKRTESSRKLMILKVKEAANA